MCACASHLQAAAEVVDAWVRVDVVVDGVGVAALVPLVGGGGGHGGLDGGHGRPDPYIRPVPKGLDGVACAGRSDAFTHRNTQVGEWRSKDMLSWQTVAFVTPRLRRRNSEQVTLAPGWIL